jgi:acyl-CoA synthetase (AMP-forming)/AMP-acid ligase II
MAENAFAVTASQPGRSPRVLSRDLSTPTDSVLRHGVTQVPEFVSCGQPIEGCEVRIVGESRARLANGEVGEIAIRSPFLFREYHGNTEATEAAIDSDGWYYTGDLGFVDEEEVFVTGRKKDLLIVSGRNFYPQDIEAICDECHDAVAGRSVAVGVSDPELGTERIVVLVESRTSDPARQARLAHVVRQRVLEDLDCPLAEVRVVPHMWLQKTSSGKIARLPNLERYRRQWGRTLSRAPHSASPSWVESGIWAAALAVALYLLLLLQTNRSWAIYAGF